MAQIFFSLTLIGLASSTELAPNNISIEFVPNSVTLEVNHLEQISVVARVSQRIDYCFSGCLISVNEKSTIENFQFTRHHLEFCFKNESVAVDGFGITPLKAVNHDILTLNVSTDGANSDNSSIQFSDNNFAVDNAVGTLTISSAHHNWLITFSAIIGWCYVIAWAVTTYPQFYTCIRRKSVVGLDFNFAILAWLSFLCYGIFNATLFWNENVKAEYFDQHPYGVNPIQPNDVFMGLNSLCSYTGYLIMIVVLDRGTQKVSWVCYGICAALFVFILISLVLAVANVVTWLLFVQNLAYVKLFATTLKYIPQVYLNYKKKSTEGWNLMFPILDFTGGSLSLLQMFLISYNFDDWTQISGDLAKFGLGIVALIFDSIFLFQRFYLYPPGKVALEKEIYDRKPSLIPQSDVERKFSIQKKLP